MKNLSALPAVLSVVLLLLSGTPVSAAADARRIEASARQSYVFRTYLAADEIKIHSMGDNVILTGTVSENFHRTLAQETIAALPGVRSIENKLAVNVAAPTTNSDAWLHDNVLVALLFHRGINAAAIQIEVKDAIVTLRGVAASTAQIKQLTDYAGNVGGIKAVKSELRVTPAVHRVPLPTGMSIDDASVSAQVNMTLAHNRVTNVLNSSVTTRRGVVTVTGKAGSSAEKRLVTRLIADINGVKRVKNLMKTK